MTIAGREPVRGTLLVVGDTRHAVDAEGRLCTYAALAQQLDQWFRRFDRVEVAAVLAPGPPPPGFAPYAAGNVELRELRAAGRAGWRGKLDALRASVSWVRRLVPLLRHADVVHLRAPCNVTLVAIPLARLLSRRRYAIYAGAWAPTEAGPISYRAQRWMLARFGGVVHVYAPASADLAPNLRANVSPSFTASRLEELAAATARRLARIEAEPPASVGLRVACVGRFSANKNQELVVRATAQLRAAGVPVTVRFAGAGETEPTVRAEVVSSGLEREVTFLGPCDEAALTELYEWADVNVAPTFVEGFGRVIVEGMALGCPAVCGPGVMQAAMVDGGRGHQVDPADPVALATILDSLRNQPVEAWRATAAACRAYASTATIDAFGDEVGAVLDHLDGLDRVGRGGSRRRRP